MRLFLIGRYADRGRLRQLRERVLVPARHTVLSSWIDGGPLQGGDRDLVERRLAAATRWQNWRDLLYSEAAIFLPSSRASPGRHVDLGLALALGKRVYVYRAARWRDLPEVDRTIYLDGATFCATAHALLLALAEDGPHPGA